MSNDIIITALPSYTVKAFQSTERILRDAEKIVFTDTALALGDTEYSREPFSVAYDKVTTEVEMLFLMKSDLGHSAKDASLEDISQKLNHLKLTEPLIVWSVVEKSAATEHLTDRISYIRLILTVVEYIGK